MEGGWPFARGGSGADRRALVVSIHDVAPSTASEVAWLLDQLDDVGVRRRVLKVIPFEGGERRLDAAPALVETLAREQASGSEIVLHGWTHLAAGARSGPPSDQPGASAAIDRIRAWAFAGDAAEFLGLTDAESARRIDDGIRILTELGLAVDGFCAPGWLSVPGLDRQLRAAGLGYRVAYGRLVDLRRRRWYLLPGFGSMGTDDLQEALAAAEGGLVLLAEPVLPVIRAFLHPQRARTSTACARTLRAIGRLRRTREPATYHDLLEAAA